MSTQARAGQETEAALRKELLELRSVLARSDDQAAWRQDQLSQEVRSLQERLQHAEARTTELAAATEEATRPLLRQIDSLQAQVMSSARSSQMIEERCVCPFFACWLTMHIVLPVSFVLRMRKRLPRSSAKSLCPRETRSLYVHFFFFFGPDVEAGRASFVDRGTVEQ